MLQRRRRLDRHRSRGLQAGRAPQPRKRRAGPEHGLHADGAGHRGRGVPHGARCRRRARRDARPRARRSLPDGAARWPMRGPDSARRQKRRRSRSQTQFPGTQPKPQRACVEAVERHGGCARRHRPRRSSGIGTPLPPTARGTSSLAAPHLLVLRSSPSARSGRRRRRCRSPSTRGAGPEVRACTRATAEHRAAPGALGARPGTGAPDAEWAAVSREVAPFFARRDILLSAPRCLHRCVALGVLDQERSAARCAQRLLRPPVRLRRRAPAGQPPRAGPRSRCRWR